MNLNILFLTFKKLKYLKEFLIPLSTFFSFWLSFSFLRKRAKSQSWVACVAILGGAQHHCTEGTDSYSVCK
jgi:hypothetical protein